MVCFAILGITLLITVIVRIRRGQRKLRESQAQTQAQPQTGQTIQTPNQIPLTPQTRQTHDGRNSTDSTGQDSTNHDGDGDGDSTALLSPQYPPPAYNNAPYDREYNPTTLRTALVRTYRHWRHPLSLVTYLSLAY
jgi:hypothetical protein